MKNFPQARNIIIPVAALVAGLLIGLGAGQMQISKERKVSQDRLKEANKKAAYFQQKMSEDKNEALYSLEQQEQKCRDDLGKLRSAAQNVQNEKKALAAQLTASQEQAHKLEMKLKAAEEAHAGTKQELQVMERGNRDLERGLKRTMAEKQDLQAELKRTARSLGQCSTNNAELCVIAEELVKKYKSKGIGAAILEKEPLTQVRKVELEQLAQKYREDIERLKTGKTALEAAE